MYLIRSRSHLNRRSHATGANIRSEEPGPATGTEAEYGLETTKELVPLEGHLGFSLDNLLRASAEVLGRGTYGTVYAATLDYRSPVAVKRVTRGGGGISMEDFEAEVKVVGKIRHDNLLALRAYYSSQDEKLLVFDYMPKGNLSALLHVRGPADTAVDWATRMNIVIGIAKGLHHLHNNEHMVHGNLTSANILIDVNTDAKIADYGFTTLRTAVADPRPWDRAFKFGYRAPEMSESRKANTKADVYSLGVVMLEVLTGKPPSEAIKGLELQQWVTSLVAEGRTNEVFDVELMEEAGTMGNDVLLNTLFLAFKCVDTSPHVRPEVLRVLQKLEEIKRQLAEATSAATAGVGDQPTNDDAGNMGTMASAVPATGTVVISLLSTLDMAEERTATPLEEHRSSTSETSDYSANDGNRGERMTEKIASSPFAPPASGAQVMPTPVNSGKNRVEELAKPTSQCDLEQEIIQVHLAGNEELHAPNLGDVETTAHLGNPSPSTDTKEIAQSEGNGVSPVPINWTEVTLESRLQMPTSSPLISSEPDLTYQRYFQTLYDLARRSPPLPSTALGVQLNGMLMGLHSLGYPLDTWLRAATLVLVSAEKREHIERYVDEYKVHVEPQLEKSSSDITSVKEEISRMQSRIAAQELKNEELDGAIAKLEDQIVVLKGRREEVSNSLSETRDQLVAAEAKMESLSGDMDRLNQQNSRISDLRSSMLSELPSLDEVFDSSFRDVLSVKY